MADCRDQATLLRKRKSQKPENNELIIYRKAFTVLCSKQGLPSTPILHNLGNKQAMPQFLTAWLGAVEFTASDVARCFVSFLSVPHGGQEARRVLVEEEETEEKEKSSCGGAEGRVRDAVET